MLACGRDPQEQLVLMKSQVMERSYFCLQMNRGLSACIDNVSAYRSQPFPKPSCVVAMCRLIVQPYSEHFPLLKRNNPYAGL